MTRAKQPHGLGGFEEGSKPFPNRISVGSAPGNPNEGMSKSPKLDLDPASGCNESVEGTHAETPRVGISPGRKGKGSTGNEPSTAFPEATPA